MSLLFPYTFSLTLKPPALIDLIQVLNFDKHFS
jgi:hypothetical protein